jgi:hypothetical protein
MTGDHLRIVLSGMLAGVPGQGGASWAVLQYLLGLRRLGHEVLFVEPVPLDARNAASVEYFSDLVERFELGGGAALLDPQSGITIGMTRDRLESFCSEADLLLNISGTLENEDLLERIPVRAFVDLDPAFTQLWSESEGIDLGFEYHNRFVTIGGRIGSDGCPVPTCGREWIKTLQPLVLERWPVADEIEHHAFTTVGHWRAYGSIECDGVHYGQKAHALRPLLTLPKSSGAHFKLALGIHQDERRDLAALYSHGWSLVNPGRVAATPDSYAHFVRSSWAEFALAKSGYAASCCGWFSDRSICYLASGRPVLALDTGFSPNVPAGEGVLAFSTLEEAEEGIDALRSHYGRHRRAARELAEELFESDRVLSGLLSCL